MLIACGQRCKYEYWVLFKIGCSFSHTHFIIDWVEFFVRAFVSRCKYHVFCWCATLAMVAEQIISTPFTNNIYHNVLLVSIDMGIPCRVCI